MTKFYDQNISIISFFLNPSITLHSQAMLNLLQLDFNLESPNLHADRELLGLHGLVLLRKPLCPVSPAHSVRKQLHLHLHLTVVEVHRLLLLKY